MVAKVAYNIFEVAKIIVITISIYKPLRKTGTKSGIELIFFDNCSVIRLLSVTPDTPFHTWS